MDGGYVCEHDECRDREVPATWRKPGGWNHVDARAPVYACGRHKLALIEIRPAVSP